MDRGRFLLLLRIRPALLARHKNVCSRFLHKRLAVNGNYGRRCDCCASDCGACFISIAFHLRRDGESYQHLSVESASISGGLCSHRIREPVKCEENSQSLHRANKLGNMR